jgi:hypothetical protein
MMGLDLSARDGGIIVIAALLNGFARAMTVGTAGLELQTVGTPTD